MKTLFSLKTILNSNIHLGKNIEKNNYFKLSYSIIFFRYKNYCVLNIFEVTSSLIKAYILFYKVSLYNNKILFVNSKILGSIIIKEIAFITKNFYTDSVVFRGILTNWAHFQQKLMLLKWLLLNLDSIFSLNLHLSTYLLKDLLNLYMYLKLHYFGILGIKEIPHIIFIVNSNTELRSLQEATKSNKLIIIISDRNVTNSFLTILGNNNTLSSIKLILKIVTSAHVKGQFQFN